MSNGNPTSPQPPRVRKPRSRDSTSWQGSLTPQEKRQNPVHEVSHDGAFGTGPRRRKTKCKASKDGHVYEPQVDWYTSEVEYMVDTCVYCGKKQRSGFYVFVAPVKKHSYGWLIQQIGF